MQFSPKQFLKSRRPEQFSDTVDKDVSAITRPELEYHISTITERNQTNEFERFAKRMCELEVCPNLLPNTGPTGGGDSKVDSETYPVSEQTAFNWYVGYGDKAATQRWGFAFSAKEKWQDKINEDIKKLVETKRGYKKAFFVSNRYIKDKTRADYEDTLKKKHKIDVRIFDRTWLLDRVFDNGRQDVAIAELNIPVHQSLEKKIGASDAKRSDEFQKLNREIEETISKNEVDGSVIDSAIRTAILVRNLEKSRTEIDGLFGRAIRLANEYGNEFHQFEAAYQVAWTTFWWHEDYKQFKTLYQAAEKIVEPTANVYGFGRLINLWNLLAGVRRNHPNAVAKKWFDDRTALIKTRLTNIAAEENRPSGSLYAETLLKNIELFEKTAAGESIDGTLRDMKAIALRSKNLVGYPYADMADFVTELSDILEESKEYEPLFETIAELTEEREGELASAELFLARAEKLVPQEKYYEAIKSLGKALRKLHKYETRHQAVRALYLMGVCYRSVGLYWAARGSMLGSAFLASADLYNEGDVNPSQLYSLNELKWLELKLGRLPQLLEWQRADDTFRQVLARNSPSADRLAQDSVIFDMQLGAMFLNTSLDELNGYTRLPDVLDSITLDIASDALKYMLGHEDKISNQIPEAKTPAELKTYFSHWAAVYPNPNLPEQFVHSEGKDVILVSRILGCKVEVAATNTPQCVQMAESLLAALESFLSTSILGSATAVEPLFEVKISAKAVGDKLISHEFDDSQDRPILNIFLGDFNPNILSQAQQDAIGDALFGIIAHMLGRMVMFRDFTQDIERVIKEELAVERSLGFTGSFIKLGNVLGHNANDTLEKWMDGKTQYELQRTESPIVPVEKAEADKPLEPIINKDYSALKHTDIQTLSVIRNAFWDKAGWSGVGYVLYPGRPPVIALMFKDIDAGKKIFDSWQKKYGRADEKDEISVMIVKGVEPEHPHYYRVGISGSLKPLDPTRIVASLTRMCTMTPEASTNIDNFKQAYDEYECYLLAPAEFDPAGKGDILFSSGIMKRNISIKDAKDVGEHDVEQVLTKHMA